MKSPCPCGLPAEYEDCCGRWHAGAPAPSAEALMRSRYSAYVKGRADLLLATWHPRTRPAEVPIEAGAKWLGLEVRQVREQGHEATVEFVARSKLGGRAYRLHENSRFVREAGLWYYVDGDLLK